MILKGHLHGSLKHLLCKSWPRRVRVGYRFRLAKAPAYAILPCVWRGAVEKETKLSEPRASILRRILAWGFGR